MERLFTTVEVAKMLKVTPRTLMRWRAAGTGPKHRVIGGLIRYSQSDLEEFLEDAAVKRA